MTGPRVSSIVLAVGSGQSGGQGGAAQELDKEVRSQESEVRMILLVSKLLVACLVVLGVRGVAGAGHLNTSCVEERRLQFNTRVTEVNKVSCDWWRAGHVTTITTSDWSPRCWRWWTLGGARCWSGQRMGSSTSATATRYS